MQFAGENLRDWLANLSHNVTDRSKEPIGLVSTLQAEDIPETGGSIDYVPDGPGTRPETDLYNEYLDRKIKELGELEEDRWEPREDEDTDPDPVDPDPVDPDPVVPDPEPEIDPEKKAAQDKWRNLLSNHIEEGKLHGRSEQESMDRAVSWSRTMTPEENAEFKWAFSETTNAPDWKKWGGGRKQGSGKGATSENSALGLGYSLGQFSRDVSARFSPTQGKVGGGRKNTATKGGRTAPSGQGAGAMRSDIQLKENITYINTSPEGHSIYEWNYKGEPESRRYQGVMAQELLETVPHAVVTMDNGYLGVKYDEIDVNFTAI